MPFRGRSPVGWWVVSRVGDACGPGLQPGGETALPEQGTCCPGESFLPRTCSGLQGPWGGTSVLDLPSCVQSRPGWTAGSLSPTLQLPPPSTLPWDSTPSFLSLPMSSNSVLFFPPFLFVLWFVTDNLAFHPSCLLLCRPVSRSYRGLWIAGRGSAALECLFQFPTGCFTGKFFSSDSLLL